MSFSKSEDHLFATTPSSFDKNNYLKLHTVSRSAIMFQADKGAPVNIMPFSVHFILALIVANLVL